MNKSVRKGKLSFSKAEIAGICLANSGTVIGEPRKLSEVEGGKTSKVHKGGNTKLESFASALRTEQVPSNISINPEFTYLVPFRLVSAAIVGGGSWKATDFSQNNVLRVAMNKLIGKPVYKNHGMWDVDNWLGLVNEVSWTESFTQNGIVVPAGIDGVLAIDTQSDDRKSIAQGILLGSLGSNSVTVEFEWEPSHSFENEWTFWELLGTMVDGRMVTRVVTRIIDFHETSIVGLGADPFAKKIMVNGQYLNIDMAGAEKAQASFSKEDGGQQRASFLSSITAFSVDSEDVNKNIKLEKETQAFGVTFSDFCKGKIQEYCDTHKTTYNDVIKKMATSAGVSEKTVNRYVNGELNCPKPYYIQQFAKTLLCQPKEMIDACTGDGCSFGDAEVEALLAGNALECPPKEPEDDDEGEMQAELAKQQAALAEMQSNLAKLQSTLQNQLETMGKQNVSTEQFNTMKSELDATKEAFQKEVLKYTTEIASLRGELESEKVKFAALNAEKVALELNAKTFEVIVSEKTELAKRLDAQEMELSALREREHLAKVGEEYLTTMRSEAIRMYRASMNGNASEEVEELLKKANTFEAVNGILQQYGQQLAEQFTFSCSDCGSHKYTFGSVQNSNGGEGKKHGSETVQVVTDEQLRIKHKHTKV